MRDDETPPPSEPELQLDPLPGAELSTHPVLTGVDQALAKGRAAVEVINAEPEDLDEGYSMAEVAASMAATDRLIEAFEVLDQMFSASKAFTL